MEPEEIKKNYILDTFSLIAYLNKEVCSDTIESLFIRARAKEIILYLNWINLGELYYIVQRRAGKQKAEETIRLVEELPIELVSADRDTILLAGDYKATNAISYADSFVIATAKQRQGTIVTGDPEFDKVEGLKILKLS